MTKAAMYFHHLHFYVRDVAFWRDWFICKLCFEAVAAASAAHEVLVQGAIEIRLSEGSKDSENSEDSEAATYLHKHPPGLVDVGLATDCFEATLQRAIAAGATLVTPVSINDQGQRECQIQGWADLRHTLVEVSPVWVAAHLAGHQNTGHQNTGHQNTGHQNTGHRHIEDWLCAVDHVVLNVPQGELAAAVDWYQAVFGLVRGQHFDITTAHSGLRSQVLMHPEGTLQMPINEPTSANSQIQEFLNHNRGAGIQHVALRSEQATRAIAHFRQRGLDLISVPTTYYDGLHQRPDCPIPNTSAASRQQLLLDWAPGGQQGMLLQTFTKPIFSEPTFFFEIIERSLYQEAGQTKRAQGFGEGNFQALFEAIERAQAARGGVFN
ncbi:MAG: 4-hydroxyphenylpyruvate dioxygenase HppD [Phormidesmis priestleyi Ana]|uniref:4-hydroxyphenylpyruvate dioxygenase HppD n=1 Tax=Phormidesmis priestleyi Ana TaxID=1666911 RepID=A0A0P8C3N2_9CYAN|nr:MAG: 4-hydroxyphenylpyruvate dioxygenase HppD [Phormidesmis priestleyi Ana]